MSQPVVNQFKVLRLFNGANTNEDWHPRAVGYTREEIALIPDPALSSLKEITSIPSPFARIHLFENAFQSVATLAQREGTQTLEDITAYHQLVSDALDVAQTFFNFEDMNQAGFNLRFVVWNKEKGLAELIGNPAHKLMGETLQLFLHQDTTKTRFDLVDNFYLLYCNNVLIGGTSPATLFFAAHNDQFRLKALNLRKGDDKFFDEKLFPLWKRTPDFQRYIYGLFKVYPQLRSIMAPLWQYMEVNLKALEQHRHAGWQELCNTLLYNHQYQRQAFEQEFKAAEVSGGNTFIDVIREVHHRRLKVGAADYARDPFAIKTSRSLSGRTPLVLQNHFAKTLAYCGGRWKPDTQVPYFDAAELEKRILPGSNEAYPYLTVSDFLEPQILRVTYPIEEEYFFNGNPEGFRVSDRSIGDQGLPGEDSFLLPLTRRFFEFFDPEYLRQTTPDGQPVLRMLKTGSDSVEVQLRIPIQSGDYIIFKRLYRPNQEADAAKNEGKIVACRFDLGFLPLFYRKKGEAKQVQQIVMLSDGDTLPTTKQYEYDLEFYSHNAKPVKYAAKRLRQDKHKHQQFVTTKFYVMESYYDFIQVNNGQQQHGIIIPKWKEKASSNNPVTVAVDFGTTNSFVAVAIGKENACALEIVANDRHLITLSEHWVHTSPVVLKTVILRSLLPYTIGQGQEVFLPMRTIIAEIEGINHSQAVPGTDITIPFFFERDLLLLNEEAITDLKWLKLDGLHGGINNTRVEAYLGMMLFVVRNYIIAQRGNMNDVSLVWLYPSSMPEQNRNRFEDIWNELAKKYLGEKVKVIRQSEAIAPFYAFGKDVEKSGDKPVLNVDVGGGTTDVVILHESKPVYSTSFRFAGNALFGNGYAGKNDRNNGLFRLLKEDIEDWFEANHGSIWGLHGVYQGITDTMGSADINSFLFSIEQNREVLDNIPRPLSYRKMLSDREDTKVVFLVFYSAIVYHLAHLMRQLELPMPRQIAFSGKAAGVVSILDAHPKQNNAAALAQLIFEKIYGQKYDGEPLEILLGNEPKERTCYGAINLTKEGQSIIEPPNAVLVTSDVLTVNNRRTDNDQEMRYKDLKDDVVGQVKQEIEKFLDFFFELNREMSFSAKFGALTGEKLLTCKRVLLADLVNNIKVGLSERRKNVDGDDHINEPVFFYPLIGALYQLMTHFADDAGKPKIA